MSTAKRFYWVIAKVFSPLLILPLRRSCAENGLASEVPYFTIIRAIWVDFYSQGPLLWLHGFYCRLSVDGQNQNSSIDSIKSASSRYEPSKIEGIWISRNLRSTPSYSWNSPLGMYDMKLVYWNAGGHSGEFRLKLLVPSRKCNKLLINLFAKQLKFDALAGISFITNCIQLCMHRCI